MKPIKIEFYRGNKDVKQEIIYKLQDENDSQITFENIEDFTKWLSNMKVKLVEIEPHKYRATLLEPNR
jgi:predicted transcriptional regulator